MSLEKELLLYLNNEEVSLRTQVLYASNAFKSSELPIQCKFILIKWLLSSQAENELIWSTFKEWFNSNHFKCITRSEVDGRDIRAVVEALTSKIAAEDVNLDITKDICGTLTILVENKFFENYFKFNVELYLTLINSAILKIACRNYFVEFLNTHIFYKSLFVSNDFVEHFINCIFTTLVKSVSIFDDKNAFLQVSKVIQRCMFYNNHRTSENFLNQLLGGETTDQCGLQSLLKHLLEVQTSNKKLPELRYKLIFHACAKAYENDSLIIFKVFITLIHILGYKQEQLMTLNSPLISDTLKAKNPSKVLLELLSVFEDIKFDFSCKLNDLNLSELLKTILVKSILLKKPSKINYQIIKKIILLDPTISQTMTEQILNYALFTNNVDQAEDYEELVLVIFDLFSKLHRIENLISKLIALLNNRFDESKQEFLDCESLKIENILTKNILQSFSKNIQSLASWQVINVFKTLLYALTKLMENKNELKRESLDYCLHMEFLSEFLGMFLSSIRVAEHTVAQNVVEKTKKCLKQLENLLHTCGHELLNRKHNCRLMRSFLNIAFFWADIIIVLRYYSPAKEEENSKKALDYNSSACNITYLHSYMTIDEWCLISERITNFGELLCKHLLYKLFIQKLRALYLFENKISDEVLTDLTRYLTADLENNWREILQNKFLINILVPTLDADSKKFLAEKLVSHIDEFKNEQTNAHILNNTTILNTVVYCTIMKCDKIIVKNKRKHDEISAGIKKISSKICSTITLEQFYDKDESEKAINKMRKIYESSNEVISKELKFIENQILEVLEVLKIFPVIFCEYYVQNFFLLYLFSLHKDCQLEFARGNYKTLQKTVESLITGVLQQYKYKLTNIFSIESLCEEILNNFEEPKEAFILIDNMFKNRDCLVEYESLILHIADTLHNPTYMECGILIINSVNKLKKIKLPQEIKQVAENYKSIICNKIFDLVLDNEPQNHLIPGYAYVLKILLNQNEEKKVDKLLNNLTSYIDFSLQRPEEYDKVGYLLLFNTVLQNKSKIKTFSEDLPMKIWESCKLSKKVFCAFDEYSQLILLVICLIPNDDFASITMDLLNMSDQLISENKYEEFGNNLKIWESIFTANINPIKTKTLQDAIEKLLSKILILLEKSTFNGMLYENILKFETLIVQTSHFQLTPAMVDILILSVTVVQGNEHLDFTLFFNLTISLLSNLLKFRKSLIMDRLPPYLLQYRTLLRSLCLKSNSDILKEENIVREVADCAYQLEKLTKSLVVYQKDMSRIAMYLIADILEQYEQVTIYPNVKMHLNNCIYSLITMCDQHAVSYLMRVLSSASTEIFKIMYENYKKYYRFTGKS